jgi:hypothetical protein
MSIFTKVGDWFAKVFKEVRTDGIKIAIAVTEGIKTALNSGIAGFLVQIIPGNSKIPQAIITELIQWIPKLLAAELALQGLPSNPTAQDILDFENRVIAAFGKVGDKSKLYTVLAAQIYGIIDTQVNAGSAFTFAELVEDVEQAYQDYQQDIAAQPDNS